MSEAVRGSVPARTTIPLPPAGATARETEAPAEEAPEPRQECPATIVENATAETWQEAAAHLLDMLGDEQMPEPMRRDIRARLGTLTHRFTDDA